MGITQQDIGSDSSTAISNLLLVTGNYRRPGMVVRIHYVDIIMFKVVVIWVVCLIKLLAIKVLKDDTCAKFEKEYGVKLNPKVGKDNPGEMVEGVHMM